MVGRTETDSHDRVLGQCNIEPISPLEAKVRGVRIDITVQWPNDHRSTDQRQFPRLASH